MGIIKADAYGHGVVRIAQELQSSGIDYLAVAILDEAIELRNNDITIPILLFGRISNDECEKVVKNSIDATVYDCDTAIELNKQANKENVVQNVHIKFDSGMGRLGIVSDSDYLGIVEKINDLSNICIKGIYSHFSVAEKDPEYTLKQYNEFKNITKKIEEIGLDIPYKHICNSAGMLLYPEFHLDMVRTGISMYGLYPSEEVKEKCNLDLKEVMSFKTKISYIKRIEKSSFISYGNTYKADIGEIICTIPLGYADGIPRILSNRLDVLINGKRCRSAGTICMDYLSVSCSEMPDYDDEVVIIGSQGEESITIDEIADKAGTINYEIVTRIGRRIKRKYIYE